MRCNILQLKPEDIRTIAGFIALFDILGYKDWIKNSELRDVVVHARNMKEMIRTNIENFLSYALGKDVITIHNYADTFLIYTKQIDEAGFKAIMTACRGMFEAAICYSLPIRGAVTCGEFYASNDILTGKPVVEAFEMEKRQEWIGCWVSDVAFDKINADTGKRYIDERILVSYLIPFKDGEVKEAYAYNWVDQSIQNKRDINLSYLIEKSFLKKKQGHSWREERKVRNTLEFFNFIRSRAQSPLDQLT